MPKELWKIRKEFQEHTPENSCAALAIQEYKHALKEIRAKEDTRSSLKRIYELGLANYVLTAELAREKRLSSYLTEADIEEVNQAADRWWEENSGKYK